MMQAAICKYLIIKYFLVCLVSFLLDRAGSGNDAHSVFAYQITTSKKQLPDDSGVFLRS